MNDNKEGMFAKDYQRNKRVRKIQAGKFEDRVIYQWPDGYRMKLDSRGFALYKTPDDRSKADVCIFDATTYFVPVEIEAEEKEIE